MGEKTCQSSVFCLIGLVWCHCHPLSLVSIVEDLTGVVILLFKTVRDNGGLIKAVWNTKAICERGLWGLYRG